MSAAELRARLAEIDAEMVQQYQRLKELHDSRVSVQSLLNAALVYPVLTLPVEITSEIFVRCLPIGNARVLLKEAPFLLLKICRQWREIALSTPRLWTTLDIDVISLRRGVNGLFTSEWVDLAEEWLRRARGHPLWVTLRHPVEEYYPDNIDLRFIKNISSQLESLEVSGLEQEEDPSFQQPLAFPLLKRLVFAPAVAGSPISSYWSAFFRSAPQLRELFLFREIEMPTPLPWHQLTEFLGRNFQLNHCLDILRLAPNLGRGEFSIQFYHGPDSLESVTHPRLRYLTLAPDTEGEFRPALDFLKLVTLPTLETLDIRLMTELVPERLEDFFSRSSPPLRHLAVCPDSGYEFSYWERTFRLIPELDELQLVCRDTEIQMEFIKAFCAGEDRLFPQLRVLILHRFASQYREVGLALEERRKQGDDKLTSALLISSPEDAALANPNIRFI
ncbi:hypothetical protein B0H19DRAFT_1376147 [Mycena capillaripes]|nr:hypothetical protein B0H19DRAFT_1376147 [Mycena capillaripes]